MYDRAGPANPCRLFTSSRSQLLTPGRPITKVRKWGVSNFGTLRTFDFQPKNRDFHRKVANENFKTWPPWTP